MYFLLLVSWEPYGMGQKDVVPWTSLPLHKDSVSERSLLVSYPVLSQSLIATSGKDWFFLCLVAQTLDFSYKLKLKCWDT